MNNKNNTFSKTNKKKTPQENSIKLCSFSLFWLSNSDVCVCNPLSTLCTTLQLSVLQLCPHSPLLSALPTSTASLPADDTITAKVEAACRGNPAIPGRVKGDEQTPVFSRSFPDKPDRKSLEEDKVFSHAIPSGWSSFLVSHPINAVCTHLCFPHQKQLS